MRVADEGYGQDMSEEERVRRIGDLAQARGVLVGAAESLTSGKVAAALGAGPEASSWFAGSVVAYQESVKFDLLGVPEGPVVTEACARQMARGACEVLKAQVAVSTTGVGGPDPDEGKPAGTVLVAVAVGDDVEVREHLFEGGPEEVLTRAVASSLELLETTLAAVHPRA